MHRPPSNNFVICVNDGIDNVVVSSDTNQQINLVIGIDISVREKELETTQAAVALQSTQLVENVKRERAREMQFLDVVSDVTSEIDLSTLLQKVMSEATRMLKAERSTLFINDEKTNELFSRIAMGAGCRMCIATGRVARPISVPRAPSAQAFSTSWPERMPPSRCTSMREPTASTIRGRARMLDSAPSSCRPPWFETMSASAPVAAAFSASSTSRMPFRIRGPCHRSRIRRTSSQSRRGSNWSAVQAEIERIDPAAKTVRAA